MNIGNTTYNKDKLFIGKEKSNKIVNDPVHGFITIPSGLLMDIVHHPYMQRLTRIRQLGLASLIYPGACHTRFAHSLGAYHLTMEAISSLRTKGIEISKEEEMGTALAILLHDTGHAPLSHVCESLIMQGSLHEDLTLAIMQRINEEKGGALSLAIEIFQDKYPRHFLHDLISGQIDTDRLDYLRRDSFYTGVVEGSLGLARIIKMLNVCNDRLVVEEKGLYSIENYLVARRLMYWQVYLHKAAVAADQMLLTAIKQARLTERKETILNCNSIDDFMRLDDTDVWQALKIWQQCENEELASLADGLLNRRLWKVKVSPIPQEGANIAACVEVYKQWYDPNDTEIAILTSAGQTRDILTTSEMFNYDTLNKSAKKYYLCYSNY